MKCPLCEQAECAERVVDQDFTYGRGKDAVTLTAVGVLVFSCPECEEEFTGEVGENAHTLAVNQHLRTQTVQALTKEVLSDWDVETSLAFARGLKAQRPSTAQMHRALDKMGIALEKAAHLERSLLFLIFRMKNRMGLSDMTTFALEEEAGGVLRDQYPELLAEFEGKKT